MHGSSVSLLNVGKNRAQQIETIQKATCDILAIPEPHTFRSKLTGQNDQYLSVCQPDIAVLYNKI